MNVQARDLRPGQVIEQAGREKTVHKVSYTPCGGGHAYVTFTDGTEHKFPAARRVAARRQVVVVGWGGHSHRPRVQRDCAAHVIG